MNITHVWQELLQILTEEVGSRIVETWFKSISFSQWDTATKTVYLTAPNAFIRDWVGSHYCDLLKTHLSRLLSEQHVSLLFLDESKKAIDRPSIKINTNSANRSMSKADAGSRKDARYPVNKRYVFESFIVGEHNSVAVAAAQAVAEQPGALYNPLLIYGNSGLGKTHLLQAVGNRISSLQPKARILYQSADRFVHEFVNSIRFDKVRAFEQRYKETDVLLVDDIQLISHKEHTQEVFFHIFNTLYEQGKQIIFSADALPDDIEGLSDRLKSRLNGALITDIQPPSLTTKIAILRNKADQQKAPLGDEVATFIASRSSSNIRELEGLLIRVLAFAALTQQSLSLDLAHKVLSRTQLEHQYKAPLDLPRVAHSVSKHFNASITELRSHKRQKNLVLARHVAMYFMKKHTEYSLRDIATYWCRKDHSTVIHAVTKIEDLSQKDPLLMQKMNSIEQELVSR